MDRRVAKRVLLAPAVIAIATTAVPPAGAIQPPTEWFSQGLPSSTAIISSLSQWLGKTIPPTPLAVSFRSDALTDGPQPTQREDAVVVASPAIPPVQPTNDWLDKTLLSSGAMISSLGEWLDKNLPSASAALSFRNDILTDGPQLADGDPSIVIAAGALAPASTIHPPNSWLDKIQLAGRMASLGEWLDKTLRATSVAVSFQGDTLPDGRQLADLARSPEAERPKEKAVYASLHSSSAEAPASIFHPLPPDIQSLGAETPKTPASANDESPAFVSDAQTAAADPLPAEERKISSKAEPEEAESKAKPVYGSLETPTLVNEPRSMPHPLPVQETKIIGAAEPKETRVETKQVLASRHSPGLLSEPRPMVDPLPAEDTKIISDSMPKGMRMDAKPVFASRDTPGLVSEPQLMLDPLPMQETKIISEAKAKEMPADAKQVFASLGSPKTISDAAHSDSVEPSAADPARFPTETDRPERHASLGPAFRRSEAPNAYVPPEKMRVAYDAPPVVERPKSIGKRTYVDDTVYSGLGSPEALLEALRHVGSNAKALGLPASLWCADFMNMVLRKSGIEATGSRAARSYLKYGKKIDEPRVGAIAIFTRGKNGGHIGIVRGTDGAGNPIIVSGNHNNKVAEALYPKSRVLAYVVPRDRSP
jgi:uncharacterized protein (TIGR02594 family)